MGQVNELDIYVYEFTLTGLNMITPFFLHCSSGVRIDGHVGACADLHVSSVCLFEFYLIRIGGTHPSFEFFVTQRARGVEADIRDELQRLGPPPSPATDAAAGGAAAGAGLVPGGGPSRWSSSRSSASPFLSSPVA